jgi:hypothetical protein
LALTAVCFVIERRNYTLYAGLRKRGTEIERRLSVKGGPGFFESMYGPRFPSHSVAFYGAYIGASLIALYGLRYWGKF